jgi:hypothetical protein
MPHLKNPLINGFSNRYHLRRENGSAEARRKRGGRSAEAKRFRRKRAEARGSVAEGSPKHLAQTLTGVPTEFFQTDTYFTRNGSRIGSRCPAADPYHCGRYGKRDNRCGACDRPCHPQLIFIHVHQLVRTRYTCFFFIGCCKHVLVDTYSCCRVCHVRRTRVLAKMPSRSAPRRRAGRM